MQLDETSTEPRGRVLRLLSMRLLSTVLPPVGSIAVALALIAIPLVVIEVSPLFVYRTILEGAFGNRYAIGNMLQRSVPLIFTGLSFAFAWRAGLFNIGAEGQLAFGALGAVWVALRIGPLPLVLHIGLALLVGLIAGGFWGWVPGAMRAYMGINEVITTIMLNFVALEMAVLVYGGPLADHNAPYHTTAFIPASAELPFIVPGTRLHAGYLIALATVLAVQFFLRQTVKGLQVRAVGSNPDAARHAGIPVRSNQVLAMVISGALAGLGGAVEVMGAAHRMGSGWSGGWGFEGIGVALLAQAHPLGIPFAAAFFGLLEAGASRMQALTGVPGSLIFIVQGLPVLLMVVTLSRRRSSY